MKRFFLSFALKQLFSMRNSEGPSLVTGILSLVASRYLGDSAPELIGPLTTIGTTLATYAGARIYSKGAKGPDTSKPAER